MPASPALTVAELKELVLLLYKQLFLLVITVLYRRTFFHAPIRRASVLIGIIFFSSSMIRPHTLYNTLPAYLLGFLSIWILVLSVVMIFCYDPPQELWKINVQLDESSGRVEYRSGRLPSEGLISGLLWVLGLIISARGVGWNYGGGNISRTADGRLRGEEWIGSDGAESLRNRVNNSRRAFLYEQLRIFMIDYILVDIATHLMYKDAFLSGSEVPNVSSMTLSECRRWCVLLPYRLLVAAIGIYAVIDYASRLFALISVGILGERWIGSWGQYWNYPPLFGRIWTIWDRGLAGFWGEFWHPIFKFGLTSIAKSTIPADARSLLTPTRRLLRLSIVFILSGIMHAAGSWTLANGLPSPLLDRNYPHLSFLTFVLQVPGIVFQQFIFQCCIPKLKNRVHRTSLKMAMLLFTCVWSLGTFPLIVADFAAGKLFQIPFLPVSIFGIAMKIYEGN